MRHLPILLLALLSLAAGPRTARGQTLADLMLALTEGGSWVSLPIQAGKGTLTTTAVPTGGIPISGCARVWEHHSGSWDVRAVDTFGRDSLSVRAEPGEPVEFQVRTGPLAQLRVDVRWSEPRDTTLHVWVGLRGPFPGPERDPCTPADRSRR